MPRTTILQLFLLQQAVTTIHAKGGGRGGGGGGGGFFRSGPNGGASPGPLMWVTIVIVIIMVLVMIAVLIRCMRKKTFAHQVRMARDEILQSSRSAVLPAETNGPVDGTYEGKVQESQTQLHLTFTADQDQTWMIAGTVTDETNGKMEILDGLVGYDGRAYWVQGREDVEHSHVLVQGQFASNDVFHDGRWVANKQGGTLLTGTMSTMSLKESSSSGGDIEESVQK